MEIERETGPIRGVDRDTLSVINVPRSLPEQRTVETSDVFVWEEEGIQAGSYELRW